MNEQWIQDYLKITEGIMPDYVDPERQGQRIEKFSLLEEIDLDYSNVTTLLPGALQ